MEMEYRELGNTGIKLSAIGYGCASIWGGSLIDDSEAMRLFEEAYEQGITYYDTGHSYGIAEERIGKVLKESGIVKRENIIISTKFATRIVNGKQVHDVSPIWIRESVDTSLRRMNLDYVDMLSIHGTRVSDFNEELFAVINDLKKQGKIRLFGASMGNNMETITYVDKHKCLDYAFIRYNIMEQQLTELVKSISDQGMGVIAGAALSENMFSNRVLKIRNKKDMWYLARMLAHFRGAFKRGRKYKFINHVDGMTGSQAALRWLLDNPCITSAVVGTTNVEHLKENVASIDKVLSQDVKDRIMREGTLYR